MTFDPSQLAATTERSKSGKNAKAKTNGQPTRAEIEANSQAQTAPEQEPTAEKEQAGAQIVAQSVMLEAPIHACFPGYATKNIDFDASPRQAAAAKVLWSSLSAAGARCSGAGGAHPDGKTVESVTMGVRWLLDRLADAIEAESGKSLVEDFGLSF